MTVAFEFPEEIREIQLSFVGVYIGIKTDGFSFERIAFAAVKSCESDVVRLVFDNENRSIRIVGVFFLSVGGFGGKRQYRKRTAKQCEYGNKYYGCGSFNPFGQTSLLTMFQYVYIVTYSHACMQ